MLENRCDPGGCKSEERGWYEDDSCCPFQHFLSLPRMAITLHISTIFPQHSHFPPSILILLILQPKLDFPRRRIESIIIALFQNHRENIRLVFPAAQIAAWIDMLATPVPYLKAFVNILSVKVASGKDFPGHD